MKWIYLPEAPSPLPGAFQAEVSRAERWTPTLAFETDPLVGTSFSASPGRLVRWVEEAAAALPAPPSDPAAPPPPEPITRPPAEDEPKREKSEAKGAGTEEKPLGKAPEENRLAFLRDVTVLLEPGQWQFDYGIAYSVEELFQPLVLPTYDIGEARFRDRKVYVPLALRVGVSERWQAFCNVPVGACILEYGNGYETRFDSKFAVRDVVVGANYLLWKGKDRCPSAVVTFDALLPTGPLPFRYDLAESTFSDGFFNLGTNLLFIHAYDPVTVFYGIGYRHRFERDYLGGRISPGEEITYNLGTGFAINDRVTLSTALLGSYQTEIRFNGYEIPGSSEEPISLRMALTAFTGRSHIIEPFVTLGLTRDATDANFGITITRTF